MGDGISQQQAQGGDAQAHQQGAPQEGQVDAALFGLAGDGAVGQPLQVEGVEIVPHRETISGAADGVPGLPLGPSAVDPDHGLAPGPLAYPLQLPRTAGQDAAQTSLHPVDAGGDLAQGALRPRLDQLPGGSLVHRLSRRALTVPLAQQGEGPGESLRHHRIVNTAHQHRRQRRDEGQADESQQRQNQTRSAQFDNFFVTHHPVILSISRRNTSRVSVSRSNSSNISSFSLMRNLCRFVGTSSGRCVSISHESAATRTNPL